MDKGALIIALGKKLRKKMDSSFDDDDQRDEDDDEDYEVSEDLEAASEAMIRALQKKDAKSFAEALCAFLDSRE